MKLPDYLFIVIQRGSELLEDQEKVTRKDETSKNNKSHMQVNEEEIKEENMFR
jgi:hypothetical protein